MGTPLKDWDIQINYGIKTGYNDAFIIDGETKDELIAEDPKSAEIIRPILRGKDIKRYGYADSDKWLICIEAGFTNKNKGEMGAEEFIISKYPSIYHHFMQIHNEYLMDPKKQKKSKGLMNRDDMGDYWWELRSCAYMEDFYKLKIAYNDITQKLSFTVIEEGKFMNNTVYFIADNPHINYLLACLNSKLIDWYYKSLSVQLGEKAVRMFSIYVLKIPLPIPKLEMESKINKLIDELMHLRKLGQDTKIIEDEIDSIVYGLYNLTTEEIDIIERYYLS